MIRGVLFDMDGLMFDTEPKAKEIWQELGEETGHPVDQEFLLGLCGLNSESVARRFLERFGEDFDFDTYKAIHARRYEQYFRTHGVPVKSGLRTLLDYLRAHHIRMALATSSTRGRAMFCLEDTGLTDYFDQLVCGDMVTHSKPHPEIYERAAALLGLPPEDCFALEDSANGIRSAHAAGCKAVMVPDLIPPTPELLSLCFAQVNTLDEVIPLLK